MFDYNKAIKKNFSNKFRNSTVHDKEFLNSFFLQRKQILKKINSIKTIKFKFGNDTTHKKLKTLNIKKNYNNNDVIKFYQKFETNLKLKKKYNKYFKKNTNIETSICSYPYLGICVLNNNTLNYLQKTNCIIKIIDKISLQLSEIDHETSKIFKILLKKENLLIKRLIK